jgi:chemotaxis protein CheC
MINQGAISEEVLNRLRLLSQRSLECAGDSLAAVLNHPVQLKVSSIGVVSVSDLHGLLGEGGEVRMAGLRFHITGEAAGQIVLLFPLPTIFRMLRVLLGVQEESRLLSEYERSAVQEVGNIVVSSFLSGLGDLVGKRLIPTPPELHLDGSHGLVRQVMANLKEQGSEVFVIQALFEDPERRIEGRFFVLPELLSLQPLLQGTSGTGTDGARVA